MQTSFPSGAIVGEVGKEKDTKEPVSLRKSNFCWGKTMRREFSEETRGCRNFVYDERGILAGTRGKEMVKRWRVSAESRGRNAA